MKKKRILAMLSLIMMLNNAKALSEDPRTPQGEYSRGNIYFGDSKYIESIQDSAGPYDVLIVDERNYKKNPNVKVIDSYRITDQDEMLEIIRFILDWEQEYPTEWERTETSMLREWKFHDLCNMLGIKVTHAKDVDFDNKDEKYYVRVRK